MEIQTKNYSVEYVEAEHKIIFKGNFRLESVEKYDEIISFVLSSSMKSGKLFLIDLTQLTVINSSGIASLGLFLIKLRDMKKKTKIYASKYVHWQALSLKDFEEINPHLDIEYIVHH